MESSPNSSQQSGGSDDTENWVVPDFPIVAAKGGLNDNQKSYMPAIGEAKAWAVPEIHVEAKQDDTQRPEARSSTSSGAGIWGDWTIPDVPRIPTDTDLAKGKSSDRKSAGREHSESSNERGAHIQPWVVPDTMTPSITSVSHQKKKDSSVTSPEVGYDWRAPYIPNNSSIASISSISRRGDTSIKVPHLQRASNAMGKSKRGDPPRRTSNQRPASVGSGSNAMPGQDRNSSWAAPAHWNYDHIRPVAATSNAPQRPDPPEFSSQNSLEVFEGTPNASQTSYSFEMADDSSQASTWAPPTTKKQDRRRDNKPTALQQYPFSKSKSAMTFEIAANSSQNSNWAPPFLSKPSDSVKRTAKYPAPRMNSSAGDVQRESLRVINEPPYESYDSYNGPTTLLGAAMLSSANPSSVKSQSTPSENSLNTGDERSELSSWQPSDRGSVISERTHTVPDQAEKISLASPVMQSNFNATSDSLRKPEELFGSIPKPSGTSPTHQKFGEELSLSSAHRKFENSFASLSKPPITTPMHGDFEDEPESSESESSESSKSADLAEQGMAKWEPQIPVFAPSVLAQSSIKMENDRERPAVPVDSSAQSASNSSARGSRITNPELTFVPSSEQYAPAPNKDDPDIEEGVESADEKNFRSDRRRGWMLVCIIFICLLLAGGVVAAILLTRDGGDGDQIVSGVVPSGSPTLRPTAPPTPFSDDIEQFLVAQTTAVGGSAALNDSSSPQRQALVWILGNQFLETYSRAQVIQRFVMVTLYFSTKGESWTNYEGWLTDQDECEWYTSEIETSVCNTQGEVDELDMDTNALAGTVPWSELALLSSQLLVVDFFQNSVAGSLASELGFLTKLVALDLFSNQISGK
jgi:hypothetical protein